jgi:glutathione S-transferase
MTDAVTFYTNPQSRGRIVRWMLEESGISYETQLLDYGTTMKAPEYLAVNPMGKVPAITHGDQVVTECAAICAYLAEAFPEAGLAPAAEERAAYFRWLFFFAGPLEAAVVNRSLGFEVLPEQQMMAGYGNFDAVVDAVEGMLANRDYITGSRFTAADVYCGAQIGWGLQFGTLPARDSFSAYWERLAARPAYLRATEIDDALVAEQNG